MYLRKWGNQCLVLKSFRDRQGKVRQSRLGHFRDRETLERTFARLSSDDQSRLKMERLRPKAEAILLELPQVNPAQKLARAERSVLKILSRYPGLAEVEHFKSWCVSLSQVPQEDQESAQKKELRPIEEAALLVESGQLGQAKSRLNCLPQTAWREFHLAAVAWKEGNYTETFDCLLKGLALDEWVGCELERIKRGYSPGRGRDYWTRFGHLWDEPGRAFFNALAHLPSLRRNQERARREGRRIRKLLPDFCRGKMLGICLQSAGVSQLA